MSGLPARCLPLALVAALVALTATAPLMAALSPQEQLFGNFDLTGWMRLGLVTVNTSDLDRGSLGALLDGDDLTLARSTTNTARIELSFGSTQIVRHVVLKPGSPDAYAVSLTVQAEDGRRFAAGEHVVRDGTAVTFRLLDVPTARLEIDIERLDSAGPVHLAGVQVAGQMTIESISLEHVPEFLPEGGGFPILILGHDSYGGRPVLTTLARLQVSPARALALVGNRRVVTRVSGPLFVTPRLASLEGERRALLVKPLEAAPAPPATEVADRQVRLTLTGTPPFEILRRTPGDKQGQVIGRTHGQRFYDDDLAPGSAHLYSVRRIDAFGNPVTPSSPEVRVRTPSRPPAGQVDVGRLPLLVVIYVDSLPGGESEANRIVESLEFARVFAYRHSGARILLETTYLMRRGPTPRTDGPSMTFIERDLRRQGVQDDAFGAVFVLAGDLDGNWGNFSLLGRTAGAFGRTASVPTPLGRMGDDPAAAWSFVHEFQHVLLQRVAASAGHAGLPTGHFTQDYRSGNMGTPQGPWLDAADAWDGQAALFQLTGFWNEVLAPYRRPFLTIDSDGDGLPDEDADVPLDEARFGSDPQQPDGDRDGLGDLAEASAGLYGTADPRNPDTDGDGLKDGVDPWPLTRGNGKIAHGSEPQPVSAGPESTHPSVRLAACWNADALVLQFDTPEPVDVFLDLDGSGAMGRWVSDRSTGTDDAQASDVYCGVARLSLRAHTPPLGVFVGDRLVEAATLTTSERANGTRLTVRLPTTLGPGAEDVHLSADAEPSAGLTLSAGRVLGLAVVVRPISASGKQPFEALPESGLYTSLFELHRLLDIVLEPPPGSGEPPETTAPNTGR